jgi:predicted GIY-YIG superfamily endonuclease
MSNYKIYALSDNFLGVRYIGLTEKDLNFRLKQHLKDYRHNFHKVNWVKKYGNEIKIMLIEDAINTLQEAKEKEIYYIKVFKIIGCNLINATDGGDYCYNKGKVSKNKGIYKVSYEMISKLKEDYSTKKYSQKDLSLKYNISKSSVDRYLKK